MPPRLPLPDPGAMSPEGRALHARILAGRTGRMVGPQRANIHSPALAEAWSGLGEMLRHGTVLPTVLLELAIIVVGRRWNSQVEFHYHAAAALKAGLDPAVVEAIRTGAPPTLPAPELREVYELARQVQTGGDAEDAAYAAILARWGERGTVELVAMIGFYTMVCIALNLHRIPLPDGVAPPLPRLAGDAALAPLPPAA